MDSFSPPTLIDISAPIHVGVPIWPGSTGVTLTWNLRVDRGDDANLTRLDMDVHVGTHVEGPLHSFFPADSLDQIPLQTFIGPALVVDCGGASAVTAELLEAVAIPSEITRLLLKTRNSLLEPTTPFQEDFVGLTPDGAQWIVDHGIQLVGIDYCSIARFGDGPVVHDVLLKRKCAIIEGLRLEQARAGQYRLVCLPINLIGTEAAPARAILESHPTSL